MNDKSCIFRCTTILVYIIIAVYYFSGLGKLTAGTLFIIRPDLKPEGFGQANKDLDNAFLAEWMFSGAFSIVLGTLLLAGAITRKGKFILAYLAITTILLVVVSVVLVNDPDSPFALPQAALLGFCFLLQLCIYRFYRGLCVESAHTKIEKEWNKF